MKLRLRELREANFLSQKALGEKSGLAQATISELENGKRSPRWQTIHMLARALKVTPQELVAREE